MKGFERNYRNEFYFERPHRTYVCVDCLYRCVSILTKKATADDFSPITMECNRCKGLMVAIDYIRFQFYSWAVVQLMRLSGFIRRRGSELKMNGGT